MIRLVVGLLLL
jgi:hypothetical protein